LVGFNVEEFTDLCKRFITCQRSTCDVCEYNDACEADIKVGLSTSTRLAKMLEMLLPELEKRAEASMQDFFDILDGK
jgi:hypothetical protein